jgi:hypothetical protein
MKMTKQEIAEFLLKANDDCSNVEYFDKPSQTWRESAYVNIYDVLRGVVDHKQYRIKPEPEFVSYTSKDAREFMGEVFVSTYDSDHVIMVVAYTDVGVIFNYKDKVELYHYKFLFSGFTKLDGSPAGRRVE